jgi:hemoglobin-like flavoprotein
MTPKQIELVRKSFDALWPFRRKLAEQFYGRFFEPAPDTRRLFPNDMERQQLKLMDTIAAIVGTLDERELFQSIIRTCTHKSGLWERRSMSASLRKRPNCCAAAK